MVWRVTAATVRRFENDVPVPVRAVSYVRYMRVYVSLLSKYFLSLDEIMLTPGKKIVLAKARGSFIHGFRQAIFDK